MFDDVETANEKVDALCSHTGPLWEIEGDVAAISKSVQGVANGTDTVSSFVSCLSKHLDDIRLVVGHKANEIRKAESQRDRPSPGGNLNQTMADCVNALKKWTGKVSATIVYDSTVDEFTDKCLFQKVKGKRNIAVIGFTTDGDVFGGFYSVAVTKQDQRFYDPSIFAFSFESHGRCETPQRLVVKEGLKEMVNVYFFKNVSGFVGLWVGGVGGFYLGNERSMSYCFNMSRSFDGLEDTTLTGREETWLGPYHHCARLVAMQLE